MNKLAENGTILFGGPLDEGEQVLLVLAVPDEASVRTVLAPDPWNAAGLLEIVSVRQWSVLLEHQRDLAKI